MSVSRNDYHIKLTSITSHSLFLEKPYPFLNETQAICSKHHVFLTLVYWTPLCLTFLLQNSGLQRQRKVTKNFYPLA